MQKILSRYRAHDEEVLSWDPLDWSRAERWTRRLPPKTNLVVPRSHLDEVPPYRSSWMGRRRGAIGQYRCDRARGNLHIKEFPTHWVMHVDAFNPHRRLLHHLFIDHGYDRFFHLVDLFSWMEERPRPVGV